MGKTTTTAYGLDGTYSTAMPSSLGGTWGEIGAGVSGQVTDAMALFAQVPTAARSTAEAAKA